LRISWAAARPAPAQSARAAALHGESSGKILAELIETALALQGHGSEQRATSNEQRLGSRYERDLVANHALSTVV
jgi:hypothetical protein